MANEYIPMGKVLLAKTSRDRKIALEGISRSQVKGHERHALESANDFLNRYLVSLVSAAQLLVTACQTILAVLNDEQEEFRNKCLIYPRVQVYNTSGHAFRIEWTKFVIYGKKGSHEVGKTTVRIPSEKIRYPAQKFKEAPGWALKIILEYEEQFVLIRQKYGIYKEIKRRTETLVRHLNAELTNSVLLIDSENSAELFVLKNINIVD